MINTSIKTSNYFLHLKNLDFWLMPSFISLLLLIISHYNFLSFHVLAEFSAIIVAFAIFAFAWYTYDFSKKSLLYIIACGYLWIGGLDLIHTLVFKDMNLLVHDDGNLSLQFWLIARYAEAFLLLLTPLFINAQINKLKLLLLMGVASLLLTSLVFTGYFPLAFIEGKGLTVFKVFSEYFIMFLMILAIIRIYIVRHQLLTIEVSLIILALIFSIVSEFTFTLYASFSENIPLIIGHVLKIYSYWFIFLMLISVNVKQVYRDLIEGHKSLSASESALQLELIKSEEITKELESKNNLQETLVNSIPDALLFTDINRCIIATNPAVETIFGYTQEELQGHETAFVYESRDEFKRQGQLRYNLTASEQLKPYIVNYQHKNGDIFPGETIGRIIKTNEGKIIGYIGVIRDVTARVHAEKAQNMYDLEIKKERDHAQHYLDVSPVMFCVLDQNGDISLINKKGCDLLGYSEQELIHQNWFKLLIPNKQKDLVQAVFEQVMSGEIEPVEYYENTLLTKNNQERLFSFHNKAYMDTHGHITGVLFSAEDISEKVKTEKLLQHAQKMEAVGELTGGIAHDFNNLLGVVLGNLELIQLTTQKDKKLNHYTDMAIKATERGAKLTNKLLTFSRGNKEISSLIQLNSVIQNVNNLIAKSITPQIEVKMQLSEYLWRVKVPEGEIEDMLLNLAINARDAMSGKGLLLIETHNKVIDPKQLTALPLSMTKPYKGEYVQLSVSDTGTGMSAEIQSKIFDPFFSTKASGKGTGLGMSMVYSFVNRAKGFIQIYSEENHGSSIHIYFPRAIELDKIAASSITPTQQTMTATDNETILIVDDEEMLQVLAAENLQSLGYKTLTAENGEKALALIKKHPEIKLVFSDVIMPGQYDGYKLALEVKKHWPKLKILLTSGYTANRENYVNGEKKLLDSLTQKLLNKPYTREEMSVSIRQALDEV